MKKKVFYHEDGQIDLVKTFEYENPNFSSKSKRGRSSKASNYSLEPYNGEWGNSQLQHLLNRALLGVSSQEIDYFKERSLNEILEVLFIPQENIGLPVNDYYDIFKELFTNHYNTNRFNKEKSKIFWIIDNISRIGVDKKKFTKMILEDFFQINLKIEYSFELVKYLDGKNLLDKTGQYNFNPLMYFHDLDKWKWFDNHFQIDWKNLDVKKSYPRPAYNIFNRLLQNNWFQLTKEKADFLLSKDPNFVKNNIVDKNFNLNSNHFLKNLYQLLNIINFS